GARAAPKPEERHLAAFERPAPVQRVSISPNGARVAAGSTVGMENLIRVFDLAAGKELLTIPEHAGAVTSLAFLPDNRTIVSTSADKTARLLDVPVLAVWEAHPGGVTGVTYNQNGAQALTCGADKTVTLWDLAMNKAVVRYGPTPDAVSAVAFSRDFTQVGAAAGKAVKVWNAADGKELLTLAHPADVTSLSFSVDKAKIVTGAADNLARVWDV